MGHSGRAALSFELGTLLLEANFLVLTALVCLCKGKDKGKAIPVTGSGGPWGLLDVNASTFYRQ
jgi:hypothetical protein